MLKRSSLRSYINVHAGLKACKTVLTHLQACKDPVTIAPGTERSCKLRIANLHYFVFARFFFIRSVEVKTTHTQTEFTVLKFRVVIYFTKQERRHVRKDTVGKKRQNLRCKIN